MIINQRKNEIQIKIVYYGPGMSGKTTSLEHVYKKTEDKLKGKLTTLATDQDRTLFFDFFSLSLGEIFGTGTKLKLSLFTVPGQVYYNTTRKLVLQKTDGVIFVADSQRQRIKDNIESFRNMLENLKSYGIGAFDIPIILQYNKRDLVNTVSVEELNEKMNLLNLPFFPTVADSGSGVKETLEVCTKAIIDHAEHQGIIKKTEIIGAKMQQIRRQKSKRLTKLGAIPPRNIEKTVRRDQPPRPHEKDKRRGGEKKFRKFAGREDDYYDFYPTKEDKKDEKS